MLVNYEIKSPQNRVLKKPKTQTKKACFVGNQHRKIVLLDYSSYK